jgi:hypothetical protein
MNPFIAIILLVALLIILFSIIRGNISAGKHKKNTASDDNSQPTIDCYWNTIEWVPVKADLQLTYKDSKGNTTDRPVSISGYDGSAYLKGFCSLKNSNRTFRIDRILNAIDTETGETINNVPDHLLNKYRQSPEYAISNVFRTLYRKQSYELTLDKRQLWIGNRQKRNFENDSNESQTAFLLRYKIYMEPDFSMRDKEKDWGSIFLIPYFLTSIR